VRKVQSSFRGKIGLLVRGAALGLNDTVNFAIYFFIPLAVFFHGYWDQVRPDAHTNRDLSATHNDRLACACANVFAPSLSL
jgi:hypothetical protein